MDVKGRQGTVMDLRTDAGADLTPVSKKQLKTERTKIFLPENAKPPPLKHLQSHFATFWDVLRCFEVF
jgi:hypothetical protein